MKENNKVGLVISLDDLFLNNDELIEIKGGHNDDGINCGSGCGMGCGNGCGAGCSGCTTNQDDVKQV